MNDDYISGTIYSSQAIKTVRTNGRNVWIDLLYGYNVALTSEEAEKFIAEMQLALDRAKATPPAS